MIKAITDVIIELGLILFGLYYIFNFKAEAARVIAKKSTIKLFGKEIRFRQSKIFEIIYPYTILSGGVFLIVLGVLAFFHIIKIR